MKLQIHILHYDRSVNHFLPFNCQNDLNMKMAGKLREQWEVIND